MKTIRFERNLALVLVILLAGAFSLKGMAEDQHIQEELTASNVSDTIVCGDANNDGLVNIVDVVYLLNYLFNNGPPLVPVACIADANGDGFPTISDIVYLNGYILKSATPPVDDCCW